MCNLGQVQWGRHFKIRESLGTVIPWKHNDIFFSPQFHEWKVKKPFSYEHIFLQGTVRKMLMWCLNTFYYNAISYIKTQLSHCFKILKYYSAKTQKDIFSVLWSLSKEPRVVASPLGRTLQELNIANAANTVTAPLRPSCRALEASSGDRDAKGSSLPQPKHRARL